MTDRPRGGPFNGTMAETAAGVVLEVMANRYGVTARELADSMGWGGGPAGIARASRWLRVLHAQGFVERDSESVARADYSGVSSSRERNLTVNRFRFRLHSRVLESIWANHREVFEAMSEQRRAS